MATVSITVTIATVTIDFNCFYYLSVGNYGGGVGCSASELCDTGDEGMSSSSSLQSSCRSSF